MAELQFVFDLSDGKKLYGILQAVDNAEAPVVVFIHGLAGHMREKPIKFSAYAAVEAGLTALRLNLYGAEPDSRKLIDCTVDTHIADVSQVLEQIRSSGRRVAVVGHSLGALVIQRLDRSLFDVAVLWDPVDVATEDFSQWPDVSLDETTGNWSLNWTADLSVTPAFYDSWWNSQPDNHDLQCSTKVICGGASNLQAECERYAKAQSSESELVTIDAADHHFSSREATERLYAETTSWLVARVRPSDSSSTPNSGVSRVIEGF